MKQLRMRAVSAVNSSGVGRPLFLLLRHALLPATPGDTLVNTKMMKSTATSDATSKQSTSDPKSVQKKQRRPRRTSATREGDEKKSPPNLQEPVDDATVIHRRQVSRVMRDDFWDDDFFEVLSGGNSQSEEAIAVVPRAKRSTKGGDDPTMNRPTSRRKRTTGVAPKKAILDSHPLHISIEHLVEAHSASQAGKMDATSSRLLHDVASAKRLDATSVTSAVAHIASLQSTNENLLTIRGVHGLCRYYAARGATLGHVRILSLLMDATQGNPAPLVRMLKQILSQKVDDVNDGNQHAASVWVDTLYELFERPQQWANRRLGKGKVVVLAMDTFNAGRDALLTIIAKAVVENSIHHSGESPSTTKPPQNVVAYVRQLFHRISVVDILLKALDGTQERVQDASAAHQVLANVSQTSHKMLHQAIKQILSPVLSDSSVAGTKQTELSADQLLVCVELAASELLTWGPGARAALRNTISSSFTHFCDHLVKQPAEEVDRFMTTIILRPEIMAQLRLMEKEAAPCFDHLARDILSCAAVVLDAQPFSTSEERLAYVQRYAQRLVDSGLPSDTLLSSQFSIGLTGQELLAILRLKRSCAIDNTVVMQPQHRVVPIPEIMTRTLMSQIQDGVSKVRMLYSDVIGMQGDEKVRAREDAVERSMADCEQLLSEFVLRGMHQECQVVATQLVSVWQIADKSRRDPVESFIRGCAVLEDFYGLVSARCTHNVEASLWQLPSHPSSSHGRHAVAHAPQSARTKLPVECFRDTWALMVSKIIEPPIGLLINSGHVAALMRREEQQRDEGSSDASNVVGISNILAPFARVLSVSCALRSQQAGQIGKHMAPLVAHVESSLDLCEHIGQLSHAFGEITSHLIPVARAAERQSAGKLFQVAIQGVLTSGASLSDPSAPWASHWPSVLSLLSVIEKLHFSTDTAETSELLSFRTDCLMTVVTHHLSARGVVAATPRPEVSAWSLEALHTVAVVMYQRRTVHLVSDAFDKHFTKCFVDTVNDALSVGRQQQQVATTSTTLRGMQLRTLAVTSVMLQKGTESSIEQWLRRSVSVLDQLGSIENLKDVVAEDVVALLRALATHMNDDVSHRVLPTVQQKLLPILRQHELLCSSAGGGVTTPITFTVEVLRTLPLIGVDDTALLDSMLARILSQVDDLCVGDCGDVAGLVPMLLRTGHDAARLLPPALAERAYEKRLLADASQVAKLVKGFSALSGDAQQKKYRDKVLTGLILRCMHVVPQMKPEELLDTLEGYLSIETSHMSLIGVIVAKIADAKDAFSLPLTIRLVTASYEAAKYDVRVSKACVTASHPVFVSLTQHFLQNDVTSLVGTANHAELILNCLCNAFSKESIADDVIRAVAQHCSVVPPNGILAALQLIALRGSADFNAANVLFQHCLSKIIPDSSPSLLALSTLRLARCGIRTGALFAAVDKRLAEIGSGCDANTLGSLCEAQLLSRRESSAVLCRTISQLLAPRDDEGSMECSDEDGATVQQATAAASPVLREMKFAQLRLVIMVLMSAGLVPLEEHLATMSVVLNRIASERSQLTADSSESASDVLLLLQQLVRLRPFASTVPTASHRALHVSAIRDAASAFATAAEQSIPTIAGHATQAPDLAKTVDFALYLTKLEIYSHPVLQVCLSSVLNHREAIQQRHVLMTKITEISETLSKQEAGVPLQVPDASVAAESAASLKSCVIELRAWLVGVSETCGGVHLSSDVEQPVDTKEVLADM